MRILDTILELIFPVNCASCGESGVYLCAGCLSSSPTAERESEDWIFPLYDYRHPAIKKSIWLLKYKRKFILAKTFALVLYPRILEEISERIIMENFINPILIPIPLSRKRLKERGFNQTQIICEEIIKLDKKENLELMTDVLKRVKDNEHQTKIENRRKRIENIIGCFEVANETSIKGRNIILIDDVTTTGATLTEAKKVLRESGARKIIAFTIAH